MSKLFFYYVGHLLAQKRGDMFSLIMATKEASLILSRST
jgi:hypothetical protein